MPEDDDVSEDDIRATARASYRDAMTGETHDQIDAAKYANAIAPVVHGPALLCAMKKIGVVQSHGKLKPYGQWSKQQKCAAVSAQQEEQQAKVAAHLCCVHFLSPSLPSLVRVPRLSVSFRFSTSVVVTSSMWITHTAGSSLRMITY